MQKQTIFIFSILVSVAASAMTTTLEYEDKRERATRAAVSNEIVRAGAASITNAVESGYLCTVAAAKNLVDSQMSDLVTPDELSETLNGYVPRFYGKDGRATVGGNVALGDATWENLYGGVNFIHGSNNKAKNNSNYSHLIGHSVISTNEYAFIYQGINEYYDYYTHGDGTFNVKPRGGLYGFWIGEQTLGELLDKRASKDELDSAEEEIVEIKQLLVGEDFRVTVTNYDSKVNAPIASFDARLSDGTTNIWREVWSETNGLVRVEKKVMDNVSSNYFTKTESDDRYRSWGEYDSQTGLDAPNDFVQVSAKNGMIISSGMGFANYLTPSGGSYWVLTGVGEIAANEEGMLSISDASGNAVIEVVNGEKKLVGANPTAINADTSVDNDVITIVYGVESEEAPTIEYAASLEKPVTWLVPGDSGYPTVVWAHDAAANTWTATVTTPKLGRGFFRASYYAGGDSYVRYNKACQMQKIVIGGTTYTIGTAVIDGKTVMTLSN